MKKILYISLSFLISVFLFITPLNVHADSFSSNGTNYSEFMSRLFVSFGAHWVGGGLTGTTNSISNLSGYLNTSAPNINLSVNGPYDTTVNKYRISGPVGPFNIYGNNAKLNTTTTYDLISSNSSAKLHGIGSDLPFFFFSYRSSGRYALFFIMDGVSGSQVTSSIKLHFRSSVSGSDISVVNVGGWYRLGSSILFSFYLDRPSSSGFYVFSDSSGLFSSHDYLPLYYGSIANVPDDLASIFGIRNYNFRDLYNVIDSGSTSSSSSVSSMAEMNNQVSTNITNINNFESDQGNNFTQSMNSVNFSSSDLISNNKFLNSATFVRTHYENMTNNTPFQPLIIYALTLGIALTVIGRLRNR